MKRASRGLLTAACGVLVGMGIVGAARGAAPAGGVGVVSHVKVVSDKVEDVSSLAAWKRAFIKEGMTDEQKAMAVWETVVKFRHQDQPANEFLEAEGHPHDPIKVFNVYGYGQCCCASAHVEALARYAGLEARGWAIINHSVPEVKWGDKWHMLDASLVTYFPQADGHLAGVEEITKGVSEWLAANPAIKGDDATLRQFMGRGGWRKGPAVLAGSPFYDDNGWLPAATHGWYATMQEYANPAKTFLYEYGTAVGYEQNVQLRKGERLVRNWSNAGQQVNALEGGGPGCAKGQIGKGDLRYAPKFGDLAPGRVGNGTHEYAVPLADGGFRGGALVAENLASKGEDGAGPAVHVKDAAKPGVLVIRMPGSYVCLGGAVELNAVIGAGGSIAVSLSDNNGLDWKDLGTISAAGEQKIDLKAHVYRRYDYRLKLEMKGQGTGLEALKVTSVIQHSQRALPALGAGRNQITFSTGAAEGTVTVQGALGPNKGKNLRYTELKVAASDVKDGPLFLTGGKGEVAYAVATPGDMTRLRIGAHYRARDKRDGWDVEASFDGGKTFTKLDRLDGPRAGFSKYIEFEKVPAGTRNALVRFSGQQVNATGLFDVRVDADYAEPAGGAAPVKVTYVWEEGGAQKRDVRVARAAEERWEINCGERPVLKSLIVERE